jgi:excisionase family DNA binding protein
MSDLLKYYNLKEVADYLKMSEDHLRRLARSGKITGRKVGSRWFFLPDSINAYIGN